MLKLKRKPIAEFKMLGEDGNGRIEGYANVFNVIDSWGDVTQPGTFLRDLQEFIDAGYLSIDHEWAIKSVIGYIVEAREDAKGLWFAAEFHSDPESQAVRAKMMERIAAGKTVELSIGYWTLEEETGDFDGQRANYLRRAKVREVSPVVAAANEASTVLSAKSRAGEHADLAEMAESYLGRIESIRELKRSPAWLKSRAYELRDLGARFNFLADQMERAAPEDGPDQGDMDALALLAALP